jgi:transcriptional regulator with XRE-family HTH domain
MREFKALTADELGRKIGKSRVSIANWENGKGCPTLKDVCAIANALDIDPRRFLVKDQPVAVGQ